MIKQVIYSLFILSVSPIVLPAQYFYISSSKWMSLNCQGGQPQGCVCNMSLKLSEYVSLTYVFPFPFLSPCLLLKPCENRTVALRNHRKAGPPRAGYALSSLFLQRKMKDHRLWLHEFEADGKTVGIYPFVCMELGEKHD